MDKKETKKQTCVRERAIKTVIEVVPHKPGSTRIQVTQSTPSGSYHEIKLIKPSKVHQLAITEYQNAGTPFYQVAGSSGTRGFLVLDLNKEEAERLFKLIKDGM